MSGNCGTYCQRSVANMICRQTSSMYLHKYSHGALYGFVFSIITDRSPTFKTRNARSSWSDGSSSTHVASRRVLAIRDGGCAENHKKATLTKRVLAKWLHASHTISCWRPVGLAASRCSWHCNSHTISRRRPIGLTASTLP